MLREQIKGDIAKALKQLSVDSSPASQVAEGEPRQWRAKRGERVTDIEVTRATDAKFGDFTTSVALKIASVSSKPRNDRDQSNKQSPLEFAKILSDSLKDLPYVEKLEVVGPGFINFFIKNEYWQEQVKEVLERGEKFGSNSLGKGKKARVEFVSANPTGPLHFGNARGGPIGDVLASTLEFSGYEVLREYIDNNRGNQALELGKTLAVRAGLLEADEESLTYKGEYTKELAAAIEDEIDTKDLSESEVIKMAGELGVRLMHQENIRDCEEMGIKFDYIVHESDLQKKAPEILSELEKKGLLKKAVRAVFFAPSSDYLKDREAVVVKSDGSYTYFTADVVYHKEKFTSGYDLVIDVFGSNTFGHVPKLKALAEVFGFDLGKFAVILYQFVRVKRGNEIVKMSKRAGNFITAREVLDEVGRDALRFFILMHDPNSHIDFDLELAKKKSQGNPVYYVQYAHARICSILSKIETSSQRPEADYQLLTTDYELALIKQITRLPELVEDLASSFAVHRLTTYATDLADSFHRFYENCRVIGEKQDLMQARIGLILATKIALANSLKLLGITAPEKM